MAGNFKGSQAKPAPTFVPLDGAFVLINQQRTQNKVATQLTPPPTLAEAWSILQKEYGAVNWLEARRLWQLRRWSAREVFVFREITNPGRLARFPHPAGQTFTDSELRS